MTDLPHGWAEARLDEVADTKLGKMLSKKSKTGVGARPYLRNQNIQWGRIFLDDVAEMDFTSVEFEQFRLQSGDLLVTEGGEVGRAAIWRGQLEECCFQKALHRVRPLGGISPEFLQYLFSHWSKSRFLDAFVTGSTIAHLPQERLRSLVVPVPPLGEQRRIVDAIEEQFTRIGAAERSVVAAGARLETLRLLSAARLLSDPAWEWTTLGEIADIKGGVTKDSKRQDDPEFVEVPYLRVANVQRGHLDLDQVTTIRVSTERRDALRLQPGDILFNEGGDRDKLGRGWVWEGQIDTCIHQNHVFRARLTNGQFDPYFVSTHGNTWGRKWFEENGKQTTNLASLSLTTLKRFPIPAPDLGEQRRVMAELNILNDALDRLESAVTVGLRQANGLRTGLLRQAFAGKLVGQDSSDESADVLLARIRSERRATQPAPSRRSKKKVAS